MGFELIEKMYVRCRKMKAKGLEQSVKQERLSEHQSQKSRRKDMKKQEYSGFDVTSADIRYGFNLLKEALPKTSVSKVVKLLYNGIMKKQSSSQKKTQKVNLKVITQKDNERQVSNRDHNLNVQKTYPKDEEKEFKYPKPLSQLRKMKTKLVAQVIYYRDYGSAAFDQQLRNNKNITLQISRNEYKIIAQSIAAEIFRALQRFLAKQCKQPIISIHREQIRTIFRVILNFRSFFEQQNIETILKFISSIYGLSDVTIFGYQAMKLYRSLQQKLKLKKKNQQIQPNISKNMIRKPYLFKHKQNSSFYKIDKVWNQQLQTQLMELYRINQSMSTLRQQILYIHPQMTEFIETAPLRSKFESSVRKALIKMKKYMEKQGKSLPQLVKLSDEKTKLVLRTHDTLHIRLKLIDFYLNEYYDIEMKQIVKEIILAINDFVKGSDKFRKEKKYPKRATNQDINVKKNRKKSKLNYKQSPLEQDSQYKIEQQWQTEDMNEDNFIKF